MAKNKTKDWKISAYSLDIDAKEKLIEMSKYEDMSQSEMLGFLINNWNSGMNPTDKLNSLLNDRKALMINVEKIDNEIKKISEQIRIFEDWNKEKRKNKFQAIQILKRKILSKDYTDAEKVAKVWQRMTGISAIELIAEATNEIKGSGI